MSLPRRALLALGLALLAAAASAAELHVVTSGGGRAALEAIAPSYERESGNHLVIEFGPSMGETKNAIPARLDRGEPIDAVVMVGYALDRLVQQGKITDPVPVALSKIGAAVRAGAKAPDIATADGLRAAMLAAHTIAVSDSASGVYIQSRLVRTLGIEAEVKDRIKVIPADPVGGVVAGGGADLGFQQISELKPVPGITLLGPIPDAVQDVTTYKGGVVAASPHAADARAFLAFLLTPAASSAIRNTGLEPLGTK